jgi:hypothetical protein
LCENIFDQIYLILENMLLLTYRIQCRYLYIRFLSNVVYASRLFICDCTFGLLWYKNAIQSFRPITYLIPHILFIKLLSYFKETVTIKFLPQREVKVCYLPTVFNVDICIYAFGQNLLTVLDFILIVSIFITFD